MFFVKIFWIVILLAVATEQVEEDEIYCTKREATIYDRNVTPKDITEILASHNGYRRDIMDGKVQGQPKGVGLKYLKWDATLAETAQEIADTCFFEHQKVVDGRWPYKVGQNLYRTEQLVADSEKRNWTRAVEMWFLEHKKFQYGPIGNQYETSGHYTQVVWDETELIGCGFASYDNENNDTYNDIAELYVCHYGPPGNHVCRVPYLTAQNGGGYRHNRKKPFRKTMSRKD